LIAAIIAGYAPAFNRIRRPAPVKILALAFPLAALATTPARRLLATYMGEYNPGNPISALRNADLAEAKKKLFADRSIGGRDAQQVIIP
jgi:hypothetical protein